MLLQGCTDFIFTATFGEKYQNNLDKTGLHIVKISTSRIVSTPDTIKHYYVVCMHRDKNETVRKVLKASNAAKAIILPISATILMR